MLFDTHVHLDAEAFAEDRHEVIARAHANGVQSMINVGFNRETIPSTIELAEQYDFIYAAVGWHPQDAKDCSPQDLEWIARLMTHPKVVALGEIGLDYYWDTSPKDVQQRIFCEQIEIAKQARKPIVIHNRDAHQNVVETLRQQAAREVGGVMHCFSGSWEIARQCLDLDFYISLGGPVTFKNAKTPKEVAANVPLERLLIETDAPYLAPHPYRGKRNETSYVELVARAIAEIRNMDYAEIVYITHENAKKLFSIHENQERNSDKK
jgi:TatD DNase family protein